MCFNNEKYYISSYCHIRQNAAYKDSKLILKSDASDFPEFSKELYKTLSISYPKFFKMDKLSRLAFLGAEMLLKDLKESQKEKTALVFSNNASSLVMDREHQETINHDDAFYPSPVNFVYTLPNICLAEISIRHSLYTENSFFIFAAYNPKYLYAYTLNLLKTQKAEKVLCGWVDMDNDSYEAFLYLISNEGNLPHNIETLNKLYKHWKH